MHAKQMQALDAIPRDRGGVRAGVRARIRRPRARLPQRGRRDGRRRARLGAGHDRGRRRRAARRGRARSGRSRSRASGPGRSTRCARRWRTRERVVVVEKAFAVGVGGIVGQNVRLALSGLPIEVHDVVAGLGGRPITSASLHRLLADALVGRLEPADLPGPRRRASSSASSSAHDGASERARTPRTSCATWASSRAGRSEGDAMPYQPIKYYQAGSFVVGNRLLEPRPAHRAGRPAALEHADLGAPRLPGLRRGARRPLRARRGDARDRRPRHRRQRHRLPGGLLDAVPRELVAAALDPLAVRQRARGRHRRRRGAARRRAAPTCASSARAATAAPSTSASPACRGCSSATTTCCSSATTTRAT